jgi:hypothetical protein
MRRIEFLISEARLNTNTTEIEAISDSLCASLLNRSQDFIQAFLYSKNIENRLFRGEATYSANQITTEYDLPADIYAINAINTVQSIIPTSSINPIYSPIMQLAEQDRSRRFGYFTKNNSIVLSVPPVQPFQMLVTYTKKLPTLAIRYGKVIAVTATTIQLDTGYLDLSVADDYFTVVDSLGAIKVNNLLVNQTTDTLTVASTTGVSIGNYVIPGKNASDLSGLPSECESAILYSLELMINARQSSKDIPVAKTFSDEFLNTMAEMFADNSGDMFQPPITRYSEWVF